MNELLIVVVLAFAVTLLLFAALAIKMLLRRGTFKRPCTNRDPYNPQSSQCACQQLHESCAESDKHPFSPLQVPDTEQLAEE